MTVAGPRGFEPRTYSSTRPMHRGFSLTRTAALSRLSYGPEIGAVERIVNDS